MSDEFTNTDINATISVEANMPVNLFGFQQNI